ncbi:MAG: hypothetical protein AM326_06375 [Candidatus Thorarchaeota archaeon SMTZ-45]|nr:MAG: hypothetical protein AM325_00150 [Candidatus Thorarchaeota archaeon SMTZ1-45]KXH76868.1 MAG: hypothetical protein AM326_06375 [Candidatus Thorarchaeota archaeon SMTZ-45]
MLRKPIEDIIREEIKTVRARRVILDHLENGLKTGTELREAIRRDMQSQEVKRKGKTLTKREAERIEVTSPKLYHNTSKLEELGIIISWKQSQYRLFELDPRAIHPVRRALGISKPLLYVTSLSRPEDQWPFVQWLSNTTLFNPRNLLVFVEALHWSRGVSRIGGRFVPDDAFRTLTTEWIQVPDGITGSDEEREYGNLQETYEFIENVILNYIQKFSIVFDLTLGPTLITLAMAKLANEYSTTAFRVSKYDVNDAEVSYY